ncbi:MAG: Fic family protein [Endozoicomonadaceae bacterium]|nr:Fic family protein [Endozoicomonadaceae bacterium]
MILKGIDDRNAGYYRSDPVKIQGSRVVLPNPIKVPDLMEEFLEWLSKNNELHPIEWAAEAHYRLVSIHPFIDGNGRTARLLMNIILLMTGYPMGIIRKNDRIPYINSLEKAHLGGSKDNYYKLIAQATDRSLNIYLNAAEGKDAEPDYSDELITIGELARKVGESNAAIHQWT